VLDGVSFTVKRGETCVIMGRSGVANPFAEAHHGISQAGFGANFPLMARTSTHFSEKQFAAIRSKVTMVFQSGALFDSLTWPINNRLPHGAAKRQLADADIEKSCPQSSRSLLEVDEGNWTNSPR